MTDELKRRRDFSLLWSGQSISQLGGQLSIFALPTIAILVLHANAAQVGALQSLEFSVVAVLAIFVGVIVDRFKRRPLMLAANLVRILSIGSLPLAFALHRLSLPQFFVCAAITAAANVVFDTAFGAFVPSLLGREEFGKGNAKMTMSASAAEAIGNSSSGVIVQFVGAPLALLLNCFAYIFSSFSLAKLQVEEKIEPAAGEQNALRRFASEFMDGLALVWNKRELRAIALTSSTAYFSGSMVTAVFALYAYRTLHMSPLTFGVLMGFGNLGLLGGIIAKPLASRMGPRTTLAFATTLSGVAKLLFLIAPFPFFSILAGRLLLSLTGPIYNIVDQEIRVLSVDDKMMGRMNATMRTLIWGALPLGALAGGSFAQMAGIHATMLVGGLIGVVSSVWLLLCPPIRSYARIASRLGTSNAWRKNPRRHLAAIRFLTASYVRPKINRRSKTSRSASSRLSNKRSKATAA